MVQSNPEWFLSGMDTCISKCIFLKGNHGGKALFGLLINGIFCAESYTVKHGGVIVENMLDPLALDVLKQAFYKIRILNCYTGHFSGLG